MITELSWFFSCWECIKFRWILGKFWRYTFSSFMIVHVTSISVVRGLSCALLADYNISIWILYWTRNQIILKIKIYLLYSIILQLSNIYSAFLLTLWLQFLCISMTLKEWMSVYYLYHMYGIEKVVDISQLYMSGEK